MNEIVQEFLVETTENLDQLDEDLIALEADPTSRPLLASVFRTIHTVKGTTGFLGFGRLEQLSHAAESLLSELRDGRLGLNAARTDVLLEVVDAIRGLLAVIEATGQEDDRDLAPLVARIEAAQMPDEPATEDGATEDGATEDAADTAAAEALAPPRPRLQIPPPPGAAARATAPATAAVAPRPVAPAAAETGGDAPGPAAAEGAHEASRQAGERSVRVDVDLLDRILRQVGELVLARNQLSSNAGLREDPVLHRTVQRLSMIVSELQEEVMKTRMQPVDQLFSKVPRVVRDLANQFAKKVRLEVEGGETELDRSLLEAVKDPLTHLVRNAVDHGLETPAERVAAGKAETGTLWLRAFHESGQVVLEVADDGAGVDPVRIGAKAIERGLLTPGELAALSEREVVDLVFRPGFSTAATVTNVSGRGVGMDVVRTNVERIGGTVDLLSTPGQGTTFRVKIPLTLAIVPALLVGSGGQRYAIPQANLLELVQLRAGDGDAHLERIEGAVVYRLRGKLLPLVRLDEVLGLVPAGSGGAEGARRLVEGGGPSGRSEATSIVVVQADDLLLGLVVDEVLGTEEIVVKPLGLHVKPIPVYAGATILGDGGVALILDVLGLASAAQAQELSRGLAATQSSDAAEDTGERHSFVLLRVGKRRRVAVPLAAVSRLEEAPAAAIEQAGGRPVLQYRGELLPLVRLEEVLGEDPDGWSAGNDPSADVPVVVYADGDRRLGLLATEILDIVEGVFEIRPVGIGRAVVGSTIVDGHATDVLDVGAAFDLTEACRNVA